MKKSKSHAFNESCEIIRLIKGVVKRDYSVGYDFDNPEYWYPEYSTQKINYLDKKISSLIKYLERYVKPYKPDDIDGAVSYFVSGVISSAIDYETLKIKDNQGIYIKLNHKPDFRKSFYHNLYVLEGNLSYFSDRWCYERVFAFKMHWQLTRQAFKAYQYEKKANKN